MSTLSPRPEAQPRSYNELAKTQQRAVVSIVQLLDQFVAQQSHAQDDKSSLVRLDLQRPSNVLLIDGERGSGKTETLLTLLAYLKAPFGPKNDELDKIRESVDEAVCEDGGKGPSIGIPVPVLDLQPLPRRTSLLMQLATRLYKLVEPHSGSGDHGCAPPLHDQADAGQKIRTAWHKLVRAAASAEPDGGRSRNLTPEDLADELEAQERERAGLYECWSKFVDQVVKVDLAELEYRGPAGGKPCLVIPIDDADMNPARCVELLELVRSLWHPRVVFLLTGHTDLFHALLQTKFESDGLSPARSESLARLYFDKVVPKHQRFAVHADPSSALKLFPRGIGSALESLFESVPELALSLPGRWRDVQDLLMGMQHGDAISVVKLAHIVLEQAIDASDLPTPLKQYVLQRVVVPAAGYQEDAMSAERIAFDDSDLELKTEMVPQTIGLRQALSLTLHHRRASSLTLRADRLPARLRLESDGVLLPKQVEAALYLAAMFADSGGDGTRLNRELTPASYPFAATHIRVDKLELSFAWPVPTWVEAMDFLRFRQRWEQLLASFKSRLAGAEKDIATEEQRQSLARLIHAYLDTLCTLAEAGAQPQPLTDEVMTTEPDWDGLAHRLVFLATHAPTPRRRFFADWALTGATMFFWSEYGLPPTTHDEFARRWLRWLWRSTSTDAEYQALFDRFIDERQNYLRRLAEQLSVANEDDVRVLASAVLQAREPTLRKLFKDMDQQSVNRWAEWFNSKPTEREQVVLDITKRIVSAVETRTSQEISDLLSANTMSAYAHFAFHVRDRLEQIQVTLPTGSSVELYGPVSLRFYVERHAEIGGWPPSGFTQYSNLAAASGRRLISSLQRYSTQGGYGASADALRECIGAVAQGERIPDLSDAAMLARAYEPPAIGLADKIHTVQPALLPEWALQIVKVDRDAWWLQGWDQVGSGLVGLFTSLHDLIVDQNDMELDRQEEIIEFQNHLCFTQQLAVRIKDSNLAFMAPEPNWLAVYELKMLVGNYGVIAGQMLPDLDEQKARTAINVYCLALVICANRALLRHPDWDRIYPIIKSQEWGQRKLGEERFAIRTAREYLARLRSRHYRGRRWQAVEAWVRYGVPLYAAPESGMTEEEAGEWLSLFADAIEQDRDQLRAVRRYRAKLALQNADRPCEPADVDKLLDYIDANVPSTHAWLRLIERRPIPPSTPSASPSTEQTTTTGTKRKPTHSARRPKTKPKATTRKSKTK